MRRGLRQLLLALERAVLYRRQRVNVRRQVGEIRVGHLAEALWTTGVRIAERSPRSLLRVRLHRRDDVRDAPAREAGGIWRQIRRGLFWRATNERVLLASGKRFGQIR